MPGFGQLQGNDRARVRTRAERPPGNLAGARNRATVSSSSDQTDGGAGRVGSIEVGSTFGQDVRPGERSPRLSEWGLGTFPSP